MKKEASFKAVIVCNIVSISKCNISSLNSQHTLYTGIIRDDLKKKLKKSGICNVALIGKNSKKNNIYYLASKCICIFLKLSLSSVC